MPAVIPAVIAVAASAGATSLLTGATIAGINFAAGSFALAFAAGAAGLIAATAAGYLLQSTMGQSKSLSAASEDRKQLIRSAIAPRRVIYGRARVTGNLVYGFSSGADKRFLHLVVGIAGHRCQAIESVRINDVEIPAASIGTDGMVTAGDLAGLVRIRRYLGEQTAADPELIAESPDGWSADHVGRGVTYLYVRLEFNREKLSALQGVSAIVQGKNDILDPRTGTTGYTNNWALCVRDYLTWSGGGRVPADRINATAFNAAANLSDEDVALDAEGEETQKRYTCDITFTRDEPRRQVLRKMLSAGAGTLVRVQGQYRLYGGAYTAPTDTLTASDAAGDIKVVTRGRRRELFNAIRGTFINPLADWEASEFPAVTSGTFEAEDGQRIWRDIELPATIDPTRAQRLARIELLTAREAQAIEVPVRYAGLRWSVWQTLSVTLPDLGYTAKPMRIVGWRFAPGTGGLVMRLREVSAAAHAWLHDNAAAVPAQPAPTLVSAVTIPAPTGLALAATTALQADGSVAPAAAATWTPAAHPFLTAHELQWRAKVGPGPWSSAEIPAGTDRFVIAPVLVGQEIEARLRAVAGLARSPWTSIAEVTGAADTTAPGAPASASALGVLRGISVQWVRDTASDLAATEVWEAPTSDPAGRAYVGEATASRFVRTGLTPGDTAWYWLRSRDRSGNVSAFAGPVSATVALAQTNDIADGAVTSTGVASWSGSHTGDWTTLASVAVGDANAGVYVVSADIAGTAGVDVASGEEGGGISREQRTLGLRILRNGTAIATAETPQVYGKASRVVIRSDNPGAGVHTYALQGRGLDTTPSGGTVQSAVLVVQQVKR